MTVRILMVLGLCGAGVVVPLGALGAAASWDGIVGPFGWIDIAVVHLVALLPLSLLMASSFPRPRVRSLAFFVAAIWFVVAVGVAWWTVRCGASLADELDTMGPELFPGRLILRMGWCLCMQLPWCLTARACLEPLPHVGRPWMSTGLAATLSIIVALILPAAYAISVIDGHSAKTEELLRAGRLVRARPLVQGLCDVGSGTPIAGMKPEHLRRKIDQDLLDYSALVAHPLPASATIDVRVKRARALAILNRADEAISLLTPLAPTDVTSCLFLAAVLQGKGQWELSSHYYRSALDMLNVQPVQDSTALANRVRAYDSLAFNAREQGTPLEAEAIYREALATLADAQAHFHFQLGRHYQQAGRPALAIKHLETAAQLTPDPFSKITRPLITQMQLRTPSCLLRWTTR